MSSPFLKVSSSPYRFITILFLLCVPLMDTLGQSTPLKSVVAQQGDGVNKLLRRAGLDPKTATDLFLTLNKSTLSQGKFVVKGLTYLLPRQEDLAGMRSKPLVDSIIDSTIKDVEQTSPPSVEDVEAPVADGSLHTTTARAGEGIFALLAREGLSPKDYLPFTALNKERLNKGAGLVEGVVYLLPRKKEMVEASNVGNMDLKGTTKELEQQVSKENKTNLSTPVILPTNKESPSIPKVLLQNKDNARYTVALSGEGIYALLRRNGYEPKAVVDLFMTINKQNLGPDEGLVQGKTYLLPPTFTNVKDEAAYLKRQNQKKIDIKSETTKTKKTLAVIGKPVILEAGSNSRSTVALPGEGIFALLRRVNLDPESNLESFFKLNEGSLGNTRTLTQGKTYLLPHVSLPEQVIESTVGPLPLPSVGNEALFGESQNKLMIKPDAALTNAVYYLISGNGGPDPGGIVQYKGTLIAEDEYTYDFNLRLAKVLMQEGATVYILVRDLNDGIRELRILEPDQDEVAYPDSIISKEDAVDQRKKIVRALVNTNQNNYQRLLVTQADGRNKRKDIQLAFYYDDSNIEGKGLAKNLDKFVRSGYGSKHAVRSLAEASVKNREQYLTDKNLPPTALIEIGNFTDMDDVMRIVEPENRQDLANLIASGLILDFQQHGK